MNKKFKSNRHLLNTRYKRLAYYTSLDGPANNLYRICCDKLYKSNIIERRITFVLVDFFRMLRK